MCEYSKMGFGIRGDIFSIDIFGQSVLLNELCSIRILLKHKKYAILKRNDRKSLGKP